MKSALCSTPVLSYPQTEGQFIIDTEASNIGIGAVLQQNQNGKVKVISYASKLLDKVQQKYSVTRKELLAIVTFLHQFRHYLLGNKFLIRTDHSALKWILSFKDPQGQLAKWLMTLSKYNFEIQHRPGSKHQNADTLSRKDYDDPVCLHPPDQPEENCSICKELKEQ